MTIPWSGLAELEMIKAGCPLTLLTRFMAMVATIAIGVIIKTEFISLIIIVIINVFVSLTIKIFIAQVLKEAQACSRDPTCPGILSHLKKNI